jgi:hypothetical protein
LLASYLRKAWFEAFTQNLIDKLQPGKTWGWWIVYCTLGLLGGSYLILLTPEISEPFTLAYFERLQPFLVWFTAICIQTLIALPLLRYRYSLRVLKPKSRLAYQIAIIFGVLLLLWLLVSLTGLGVTASDAGAGWNYLGAPVLETQAFLAWLLGMAFIGLALWGENHPESLAKLRRFRLLRMDIVVSILIWLAAFLIWNSTPLIPNWFAAPPRAPNNTFYPNSDASLYDTTAQSALTGVGYKTHNAPFAIRPMYAFFLATLHAIGGPDYTPIIWMQVAVLSLIPVLLYWISRNLHNRVSALIAALLLIFRETSSIILGSSITTSHVKLLMADLPTTLGVMLFVLLIIRWLQNPAQRQTLTLMAGGVTGAFMLIRPEFGVLLPFIGFAALLQLVRRPKVWLKGMALIAVGVILMLLPWIWRNYQITGTIFLDSPYYRADLFAHRYSDYAQTKDETTEPTPSPTATPTSPQPTPTPRLAIQPGESSEEFAERLAQDAAGYARNNPGAVAHFIFNHFFNSQVQSVLYLPLTFRLVDSTVGFLGHKDLALFAEECCSAQNYIRRLPFWFKWDGELPGQSIIPLTLNLFLIAIGLACTWKKQRFIGLVPLAASFGYTLINAVVRNSGGRYILPIDWVGMLYFAIGLGQLSLWLIAYFRGIHLPESITGETQAEKQGKQLSLGWAANLGLAAAIILVGCALPLSEKIIPERYTAERIQSRQADFSQSADPALYDFLQSGGVITQGRALYPRFHKAGQGEDGDSIRAFMPAKYAKVSFYLTGPYNTGVVLPQQTAPTDFPNGADVLVVGCPPEEVFKPFEALVVVIYDDAGEFSTVLERELPLEGLTCPLPAP